MALNGLINCECTPACPPLTEAGPVGPAGATGPAPSLAIGTVTSVPYGNPAVVDINSTGPGAYSIDFTLVTGPTGDTGPAGPTGPAGTGIELLTATGQLITFSTVAGVLNVGSDGQVLVADSAQAFGIKWGSVPSGSVVAASVTFTPVSYLLSTDVQAVVAELASKISPFVAKGDLMTFNGTIPVIETVGADGTTLVADSTQASGLRWGGGSRIVARKGISGTYLLVNTDSVLEADTSSAAVTVNLSLGSTYTVGQLFTILDAAANAGTNNITINTSGGQTLGGATTFVINVTNGTVTIYWNGTKWLILS